MHSVPNPIDQVLARLKARLGHAAPLVERWDEDVCSVGRRGSGGDRLVFIASRPSGGTRFDAALEPGQGREMGLDFDQLLDLVRRHLGLERSAA